MADVIIAAPQTDATKQEMITALAQKELKFASIMSSYAKDVSAFAVKGLKSISFPSLTSFQVGERGSGLTLDSQALVSSTEKLELNINAYLKWTIDESDEIQSTLNWELETISRAASSHGRFFDLKCIAESLSVAQPTSFVGNISRDGILEGREYIKKNEGNLAEVTIFVAANQMTSLLKVEEFTRAEVYGAAVIPNGMIGRVYGMSVVEHNGLADGQWFMSTKDAVVYGFQREPQTAKQLDIDLGSTSYKNVMDALYGVKALAIGQGNAPATKSPFIFKHA
jgi:hypothetical protein